MPIHSFRIQHCEIEKTGLVKMVLWNSKFSISLTGQKISSDLIRVLEGTCVFTQGQDDLPIPPNEFLFVDQSMQTASYYHEGIRQTPS